jgi:hypothetical protein
MEIGARPFGITIRSQAYVTIRDIAIFGGRGRSEKGSATNTVHILVDDSSHIQLLNISSYHHGGAIRIANGSRNNLISALDAYGHQSTAVYFWKAGPGNIIEASDISRSGNVITDKGDMGLVGVFQSPQTTVRNCRLSDNGHHGALRTDGAISYVQSPGGQIVGNTITNAGGTGIKVAVGSDECLISHNRIDGWCTRGSSISTQKSCDGIRIGGGPRHEQRSDRNCKISNNQIISSIDHGEERAALKIMDMPTEGLIFENNEVIVMPGTVLVHAEASPRADEWTFRDNTYRVESHQHVIYRLGQTTFRAWEILGGNLGRIYSNYGLEQGSSVVIISDR